MSVGATWHDEDASRLIRAGADTQTGSYRERNEDFVLLDPDIPLALVLDGMGGQLAGERAARVGAEAIRDRVKIGHAAAEPPETLLEAAFRAGHAAVLRLHADPELRGVVQPSSPLGFKASACASPGWATRARIA